jgi:hypothetical protein
MIRVPKIRKTSVFFEMGILTAQTRYAGRAMMARSVRTSMAPVVFQNGTLRKVSKSI